MKYKLIDTHCHLNSEIFMKDIDKSFSILEIDEILVNVIGTDIYDSKLSIELSKKYNNSFSTIGIHPCNVYQLILSKAIDELESLYLENKNKIIAIGEIGLDYHYEDTKKEKQKEFFIAQIELSIKYNLPLVLHIRDAHDDAIEILKSYSNLSSVVIHCYSDNLNYMKQYLSLGFYISISGIVTFKNAKELQSIIKYIPKDKLLTETDSPYLAPTPHRSSTNIPSYIKCINEYISDLLNINIFDFNNQVFSNAIKCFKIKF